MGAHDPSAPILYMGTVYWFIIFLFYLYSCANMIEKLITKAKAMATIENQLTNGGIIVNRGEQRDIRSYLWNYVSKSCLI